MRSSQYLVRLVVFLCVALDPSGGGAGIALGVAFAVAIAAADARIVARQKKSSEMT